MAYTLDTAVDALSITPSDTADIAGGPARAIYVGGAGSVVLVTRDGTEVTFVGVPAGSILPVNARRVKTDTTATNLVALF